MFSFSKDVKLFLMLGGLVLAYVAWTKTILNERSDRIENLTAKILEQQKTIDAKDIEISELDKFKKIEEGLTIIIEYQSGIYRELEKEYKNLRKIIVDEIYELEPEERSEGKEIYSIWKLYNGEVK